MKQITIRKARHICSMPACGCTDTYRISGSPNTLGGFYLCGDCIATLARLAGVTPQKKPRRTIKSRLMDWGKKIGKSIVKSYLDNDSQNK